MTLVGTKLRRLPGALLRGRGNDTRGTSLADFQRGPVSSLTQGAFLRGRHTFNVP